MTGRVGKPWIDTAKPEQVKEHPHNARAQKFRNGWLKVKNEISAKKWTRISMPKTETNSTRERIARCLSRLSGDFSNPANKSAALAEISKLVMSQGMWGSELVDLNFAETYTANQLQQLRKNCKSLLKKDPSDGQIEFLTAIFTRVDSDLVVSKGYAHSKLPEPPAPNYVVPSPADAKCISDMKKAAEQDPSLLGPPPPDDAPPPLPVEEGFVEIDLNNENAEYPEPVLQQEPKETTTEEHILDEIDRDMARHAAERAKTASSQLSEGPPPPSDDPLLIPVDVKEEPKALEAVVEEKSAEDQNGRDPPKNIRPIVRRVPRHVRNVTDQSTPKKQMTEKPIKEQRNSFDFDQLERQIDVELKLDDSAPDPKADSPASETTRISRPMLKQFKPRPRLASIGTSPDAPKESIQSPRSAAPPQVTAVPEKDASDDAEQTSTKKKDLRRKALWGNSAAAPLEKRPHWLQGISVPDSPPAERARMATEALMRMIEHANPRSDVTATWLFHFLNIIADPALDEFIPGAITGAVSTRLIGDQMLRFVRDAIHTLREQRADWKDSFAGARAGRLEAILAVWARLEDATPALRLEKELPRQLSDKDWSSLRSNLSKMDLPAPVRPAPAPRTLRREWPQNNT
jgi:hypothetical protein